MLAEHIRHWRYSGRLQKGIDPGREGGFCFVVITAWGNRGVKYRCQIVKRHLHLAAGCRGPGKRSILKRLTGKHSNRFKCQFCVAIKLKVNLGF